MKDKLQRTLEILAEVEQEVALQDRDECYDHVLTILGVTARIGGQIKISKDHIEHTVAYRGHSTTEAMSPDYVP